MASGDSLPRRCKKAAGLAPAVRQAEIVERPEDMGWEGKIPWRGGVGKVTGVPKEGGDKPRPYDKLVVIISTE
jgi:hypothetical protein